MADFTLPLDIDSLEIINQTLDTKGNITFDVISKCTETTCYIVLQISFILLFDCTNYDINQNHLAYQE
jgi:hypothetical protein